MLTTVLFKDKKKVLFRKNTS